jgi:hypothetical protein
MLILLVFSSHKERTPDVFQQKAAQGATLPTYNTWITPNFLQKKAVAKEGDGPAEHPGFFGAKG